MPDPELTVRPAEPAEAEQLAHIVNTAYGRTPEPAGWTSEADLVEGQRVDGTRLRELMAAEGSVLLAAEQHGETVGCVHLVREAPGVSHLGLLSVRVDHQDQGLGRALLEAAEAYARDEQGAGRIVMHVVSARGALLAWYERRGYERTGETEPFEPPGEQRSLAGELSFEVLEKPLD